MDEAAERRARCCGDRETARLLFEHSHPRGRHKARVFESALGITANDAEELRQALLNAARTQDVTATVQDEHGQRFVLDFSLKHGSRQALVRSSWIIRAGEKVPRLATCYVL